MLRTLSRTALLGAAVLALGLPGRLQAQTATLERTFYVPMDENEMYNSMTKIFAVSPPLRGQINIVPSITNTIIRYDHWEDDYEDDINNPTQATTLIWGDGILTNGVLPGYPTDLNINGGAIIMTNDVPIPRIGTNILYDSRDKIKANLPIAVSRVLNERVVGESLAGAVNMYPYEKFGFVMVAPVGTNTAAGGIMFQVVDMFIMSASDNNIVRIDLDGDGIFEDTEILNEGESYTLEGCQVGARAAATYPIQGHLITGAIGGVKQMRFITLVSDLFWDDEYLAPVGAVKPPAAFSFWLYNDNLNAITTTWETLFATGRLVINSRSVTNFAPALDTAVRFSSNDTNVFQVLGTSDTGGGSFDWGLGIFPESFLTEMILVGYGPGSDPVGVNNGSPIWFTPNSNTTVYIDFDADPTTGAFTDPKGNQYDASAVVSPLNIYRVYDTGDDDQTGLRIYTLDKTELAGAWGEDEDAASAGSPYIDMGYSIFPLPILVPSKGHGLYADNDGDGLVTPGDELIYTIKVSRLGFDVSDGEVIITDDGPINATYSNGTTVLSGTTNLSDSLVPPGTTFLPLDETGTNVGFLGLGETVELTYRATVPNPFPADQSGVINCVDANGTKICYFTPIYVGGAITGKVLQDIDGDGDTFDPDPGIENAVVVLYEDLDCDSSELGESAIYTQRTASTGGYFFNVPTGCYVLISIDLGDYYSTGDTDGANDNRIATIIVSGGQSSGNNFLDSLAGFNIDKTASPGGTWFPLQEVTYNIILSNTGQLDQTGVWIVDRLTNSLTAITNSTTVLYDSRATNTFVDFFSYQGFTNSDGTEDWFSDWVEVNDDGDPSVSNGPPDMVGVYSNRLYFNGDIDGNNAYWIRSAELSDLGQAEISFTYGTSVANDGTDRMQFQVSTDAVNWVTMDTYSGNSGGFTNYNLTPYIGDLNYIRFVWNNKLDRDDEHFWFDDVRIRSTDVNTLITTGSEPSLILTNYNLLSDGGIITVTFTALVGLTEGVVSNSACFQTDSSTGEICATVVKLVDTAALPFRVSGRVFNDIDGDADINDNDDPLVGVTLQVFTDPNGDGDPSDGASIRTNVTDEYGYFLMGTLVNGDYVLVQTDEPGFASTGDSAGGPGDTDNRIPFEINNADTLFTNYFFDWTISGIDIVKTNLFPGEEIDFGETLTYYVTITNTRNVTVGGIWVEDVMPAELGYGGPTEAIRVRPIIDEQVADLFNAVAYTNQYEGERYWITPWQETGDDTSPFSGDIDITADGGRLVLHLQDDDNSITRGVDLTSYEKVTLEFEYRKSSLEFGEGAWIQIRTNTADPWTILDTFAFGTDFAYNFTQYNVNAYISTSTWIRFATFPGGMGNADDIYFENLVFRGQGGGISTNAGQAPDGLITNYNMIKGEFVNISFDATIQSGEEVVNQACVYTAADTSGAICATASNVIGAIRMTQGVLQVDAAIPGAVKLSWTHATNYLGEVNKDYDLLYVDHASLGWSYSLTDEWALAATVFDSGFLDTGSATRTSSTNLGDYMRFYRAARRDKWKMTNDVRFASEDIFVAKTLQLEAGENWVSIFGDPQTNTIFRILGTNQLPACTNIACSTQVEWYGPGQGGATNTVWLAYPGIWMYASGGVANSMSLPVREGFNIVIPTNGLYTNGVTATVISKMPTNYNAEIHRINVHGTGTYNVVSWNWPYRQTLANSGLRFAGFSGAPTGQEVNPNNSDELRIFSRGDGSLAGPEIRILMNSANQFVYWSGGGHPTGSSAEDFRLEPDQAYIIYTRQSGTSWNWDQQRPYPKPTVTISP